LCFTGNDIDHLERMRLNLVDVFEMTNLG
jgi:hypothetical protein